MGETLVKLQGLDLKTDASVQKICENYNSTSGSTRSVLYVLLLINVLALIAVVNTHPYNWTQQRIDFWADTVMKEAADPGLKNTTAGQTQSEINRTHRLILDQNIRSKIDNYQNVKVPILGNAFDINNLSFVTGISFVILLIILRFTLSREKNNLRLALEAINDRYPDEFIEKDYNQIIEELGGDRKQTIRSVNYMRRKYHYNFLSMNEVFNIPPLSVSDNFLQRTLLGKIVIKNLFYFPYFIYLGIIINDSFTVEFGLQTSPVHTLFSLGFAFLSLNLISYLCHQCNIQKVFVHNLFHDFHDNGYKLFPKNRRVFTYRTVDYVFVSVRPLVKTVRYAWRATINRGTQTEKRETEIELYG